MRWREGERVEREPPPTGNKIMKLVESVRIELALNVSLCEDVYQLHTCSS